MKAGVANRTPPPRSPLIFMNPGQLIQERDLDTLGDVPEEVMNLVYRQLQDEDRAKNEIARIEQERINQACDELDRYINPNSKLGRPVFNVAPYWHAYWTDREGKDFWSWKHNRAGLEKMIKDTPGMVRRNIPKSNRFQIDGFKNNPPPGALVNQFGRQAVA